MINRITKYFIICFAIAISVGCKEAYRYPCQDPDRAKEHECSPKMCEVTRLCPKK